jgi:hypothetical protein
MKVIRGPEGAETTTMEKERSGNLTAGYLGVSYASSFTPHHVPYRLGMMEDKTLITDIKTMGWVAVDSTATRSALLPVIPVPTSFFLASTLLSRNQTFVQLLTVTPPTINYTRPTASYVFDWSGLLD